MVFGRSKQSFKKYHAVLKRLVDIKKNLKYVTECGTKMTILHGILNISVVLTVAQIR